MSCSEETVSNCVEHHGADGETNLIETNNRESHNSSSLQSSTFNRNDVHTIEIWEQLETDNNNTEDCENHSSGWVVTSIFHVEDEEETSTNYSMAFSDDTNETRVSSNVEDSSDGAVIEMNNAEKKYDRAVQLATPSSPLNSAETAHVSKPSEDTKRIGRSVNIKATTFDKHPKREWPWLKDEEENHPIGNVHSLRMMSLYEEANVFQALHRFCSTSASQRNYPLEIPPFIRRFYRKLCIRTWQRKNRKRLFNLNDYISSPQETQVLKEINRKSM